MNRLDPAAVAVVAGLGVLAIAVDVVTGGDVGACVGIMLGVGVLALVWFIPLRWSVSALLVLGVTMEAPYEAFAGYQFRTPVAIIGQVLLANLNSTTHVSAMKFSGFDVMLIYLNVVHWMRRSRNRDIDGQGSVPLAKPMVVGVAISLSSILFLWIYGIGTGGEVLEALVQGQKLFYSALLMLLCHAAYRGSKDLRTFGFILIGSAMYRALLATYIHHTLVLPHGEILAYSTTHGDSRLFAAALALLVVAMNERVPKAMHWTRLLAVATVMLGMVENGRRLVWVAFTGCMLIVALVSPWTPLKRRIARTILISIPVACLYLAAGWNNPYSRIFKPVGTIRSILDAKSDTSTMWRDLENTNLVLNISAHPFWGTGYGHPYIEHIILPDISAGYPRFRMIPHNSFVAFFVFGGPLGVAGAFSMLLATVFLSARVYHRSPDPTIRTTAMMCIVLVYLHFNQTYGDIGVSDWLTTFTLAPAMMLAGKLAVETGAFPWKPRKRRGRAAAFARDPAPAAASGSAEGWATP